MSSMRVRTHRARAAVLVLSVPLLVAGAVPASAAMAAHSMTPASDGQSQFDMLADSFDATPPPLPCLATTPLGCFGPDSISVAYGIQPVLKQGIDGKGQTIVIVDAFTNPNIRTDLAKFDNFWGINQLDASEFRVIAPFGVPTLDLTNRTQVRWSQEISLDVEWAHATAPKAHIVLVEATSEKDADLVAATKYAVDNNLGDVITQSFGEAETCIDPAVLEQQHAVFQAASNLGITVFAASGDWGAAQPQCDNPLAYVKSVSTPASDPLVTGVGGTQLLADKTGAYMSEAAWNSAAGASGGGFSSLYRRPGFQAPLQRLNHKARGVPDVAYNAFWSHTNGYILVWLGHGFGGGGTSAGTPQWAGIIALADQAAGHRLGSINRALYHIAKSEAYSSAFHDIAGGTTNSFAGFTGYPAGPGWDPVTGLGSPNVANLIPLLVAAGDGALEDSSS